MAVNYAELIKNDRMQAVLTRFDGGPGAAILEIWTIGYGTLLSAITLSKPSFTLANGVLTLAGGAQSDTDADNNGIAAVAQVKDSTGVVWLSGLTVGVGSGDLQVTALQVIQHQTVTVQSGTISHAA